MNPPFVPRLWRQSFPFTCGPAALGTVLCGLGWRSPQPQSSEELRIWRESTAVVCPGAHPLGLACAAHERGFEASVTLAGPPSWLWGHIRTKHGFRRRGDYAAVERSLARQCARFSIPVRRSGRPPRLGDGGVLLTPGGTPGDSDEDPHWVGLLLSRRGLLVADPLRRGVVRSSRSFLDWWETSGFQGTRSYVAVRRPTGTFGAGPRALGETEETDRP